MFKLILFLTITCHRMNLIESEGSESVSNQPKLAVNRVTCDFSQSLCEYKAYNAIQQNGFVTPFNGKIGKLVSPEVTGDGPFCLFASFVSSGLANRNVLFKVYLDMPGSDIELYSMTKYSLGKSTKSNEANQLTRLIDMQSIK